MPDSPERRWRGSPRGWPVLQGILPIERSRVPAEMLAGLTLAALGIPAVLGYAKIAGMPLVTGLYTMLLPMAVFAVLGSSRHLVVAADSATAVILAAALTGLAAVGSERYVRLAGLAALLTAGMLLAAWLATGWRWSARSRAGCRAWGCPPSAGMTSGRCSVPRCRCLWSSWPRARPPPGPTPPGTGSRSARPPIWSAWVRPTPPPRSPA